MQVSYANEMCATVQRASRMSRTSLSDAAVLLVVAKVLEMFVKCTMREKWLAEVKDENNTLFIVSTQLISASLFLALEMWFQFGCSSYQFLKRIRIAFIASYASALEVRQTKKGW